MLSCIGWNGCSEHSPTIISMENYHRDDPAFSFSYFINNACLFVFANLWKSFKDFDGSFTGRQLMLLGVTLAALILENNNTVP